MPGQEQPRAIQLDPESMQAITIIDNSLAQAPLSRQGHVEAQKAVSKIAQTIESLTSQVQALAKENSSLKGQVVDNVIENPPRVPGPVSARR